MASDSDYVKIHSVARSAMPDKETGTRFLVPKMISMKRVRILGLAAEHDESAASSRRTARVWVQAERLDIGAAVRRVRQGNTGGRKTGAMHKVPSFTMSTGQRKDLPAAGVSGSRDAVRDDAAAHIERTVRVYRIVCTDPSAEREDVMVVTTGPGRRGAAAEGRRQVLSLRGLVPEALLEPTMEHALVAHLCEERTAHKAGAGSSLDLLAVSARSTGLKVKGADEVVVEAKCDGETISVWRVLRDEEGNAVAAAGGDAPVPLVLRLQTAAEQVGGDALLANGDVTGVLLAVASRTVVAAPAPGETRRQLRLVPVGKEVAAEARAAAAAAEATAAARTVVRTEDGNDVWRDTWDVAEADIAAVLDGPFPTDKPLAADPDGPRSRPIHSHTRRQPMVPTPFASKRATLMGLDGGPRSSPYEPKVGTGFASGSGRVKLVARALQAREEGEPNALVPAAEGATPSLIWVTSVDPASSQERCAAFTTGASPVSAAAGGAAAVDGVVPRDLASPSALLGLVTHLLDDRVVYSELAARWWRREALRWPQLDAVADALRALRDGAAASSVETVVAMQGGDAASMARSALPCVVPFESKQPLTLTPALARAQGLSAAVGDEPSTGTPTGAESRIFVVEARCAGDAILVRLVNPPAGTVGALKSSSRVKRIGLKERSMVGELATPPAALLVPLAAAQQATGTAGMDVPIRSVLLSVAERVCLVRDCDGDAPSDGVEPEEGKFFLRLVLTGPDA